MTPAVSARPVSAPKAFFPKKKARPTPRRPGRPAEEVGPAEQLRLDACWHWEGCPATDDMDTVLDYVAGAMAAESYTQKAIYAMRLALAEAVSNAIRHGHRGDLTQPVRVRHHTDARRVLVEVEDQGPGFNPAVVPDPTAPENLERPCGRGLLLMRAYADWVRYNGRGNCVTLCKYRSS
jgi:serine/threonine-protein kinase RsbW